jgi:hypothetical protein
MFQVGLNIYTPRLYKFFFDIPVAFHIYTPRLYEFFFAVLAEHDKNNTGVAK